MAKKGVFESNYTFYGLEELRPEIRSLVDTSKKACATAYAPYSEFKVGAAVLLSDNSVHTGSNQENAAYPSGLCAERVLLNYVHANFPHTTSVAMAIAAEKSTGFTLDPVIPCGACLQVMGEMESSWEIELPVYLYGEKGVVEVKGIRNFLPFFFTKDFLKQ